MRHHAGAKVISLILALLLLTGCGTFGARLNRMEVSMSKNEVRELLGSGYISRAAKVDGNGNVLDLWEYNDQKTKQTYRIYFLNDKVSQWGHQQDLEEFPELFAPKYRN